MIAPSLYQHQRLEHRRGRGSPSLAAVCDAQVPAAHDKAQDGLTQVPGRSSPVRTGGGLAERSRLFSHSRCAPVSHDLDSDIAASLEALLAKIQAKRAGLK